MQLSGRKHRGSTKNIVNIANGACEGSMEDNRTINRGMDEANLSGENHSSIKTSDNDGQTVKKAKKALKTVSAIGTKKLDAETGHLIPSAYSCANVHIPIIEAAAGGDFKKFERKRSNQEKATVGTCQWSTGEKVGEKKQISTKIWEWSQAFDIQYDDLLLSKNSF